MTKRPPVVLIIRDGWGQNPNPDHDSFNAIHLAKTPVADGLFREWPSTLIHTSSEDVGLPKSTMGNSEVGHQNIGAGRIVDQDCMRITNAVRDGDFFDKKALIEAFEHAEKNHSRVHVMGLVSDGRVHSDQQHLHAIVDLAAKRGIDRDRLLVHAFTDGRDTAPKLGLGFIEELEKHLEARGVGRIVTVSGRYYAMDRDHRWDRVSTAFHAMTQRGQAGHEVRTTSSVLSAIQDYYHHPSESSRKGDEFIVPTRVDGMPAIEDHDAIIFFNYRGDRPRELVKAFIFDDHDWDQIQGGGFDRGLRFENLFFVTMCAYESGLPVHVVFEKPPSMEGILGDVVSREGLTQFRCAETEKFPHVTFFFNDYREPPFEGESREILSSPKDVTTYDQKPEMAAYGVRDAVLGRLEADDCESLLVVNFANGDMVGHTGVLDAAIRAVEIVDACVGEIIEKTLAIGGGLIVTADHGNSEQMWDPASEGPHTAHTTYQVPLHVIGKSIAGKSLRNGGRLADIAPTVLQMMGIPIPAEMSGKSLLAE